MDNPTDTTADQPIAVTSDGQAVIGGGTSSGRLTRRNLLMGCAMLAVSGFAFARTPTRRFAAMSDKQFEALFPRAFGDWQSMPASELILPPESELANKLYEHILTRSYQNSAGDVVMFLAAFSSAQIEDVQLHRPEVCYAVAGFKIAKNDPYELRFNDQFVVPARVVLADRPLRAETILYWTRVGDDFPAGWTQQRFAMVKANLEGYYPDGILIRASVINDGKDDVATLASFYRDMEEHVGKDTKRLLFNAKA